MVWVTLILFVATLILSEVLRPKPNIEQARPANIGDFQFPTATEGRAVPLFWGTVRFKGPNVVWYGDLVQEAITEKIKTGLFSSQRITKGFRYNLGIQFGICRMQIDNLRKVWIGDDLVADGVFTSSVVINEPDLFGGDDLGQGGVVGTLRIFRGSETQAASTYLAPFQDEGGDTPAYRGTCHFVWEGGYLGNSTQIKPWAYECRRIPQNGGVLGPDSVVNGADANPMAVIWEILTNDEWGFGFPPSDISAGTFQNAAHTLFLEGNGWSFQLENALEARDLLREIERQIDGIVFLDLTTGQWSVQLARGDYDIDLVPQLNKDNIKEVQNYTRGAWEDTTNDVKVNFADRTLDYKETFALAQDMANVRIQSGVSVSASEKYPGVKNAALANSIAWRELRGLSYPLARADFIVDRTFYTTVPGDVLAWTDEKFGFTKLPMRVSDVDLGQIDNNEIRLSCVQDIFVAAAGTFGDPPGTGWVPPSDALVAYPVAEQLAFEAPRAFVAREPGVANNIESRVWCGARRQGAEVQFLIRERNAAGAPAGAYGAAGESNAFVKIGELKVALQAGTVYPTNNILLVATPDSQAALIAALTGGSNNDVGTNLTFLLLIGEEFILMSGVASANAADVELDGLYRGALDSVQAAHAAGVDVYILSGENSTGGNLSDVVFNGTNNVEVKLIPKSLSDELLEASATLIAINLNNRTLQAIPPSAQTLNTVLFPSSVGLEGNSGSGLDNEGIDQIIRRRDWRTSDGLNEIAALNNDAAVLFADYPSMSEEHQVEVRNDPDGADTLLYTIPWFTGTTQLINRETILRHTNGVIPSRMRLVVLARHTINGVVRQSRFNHLFDFDTTSNLTGDFNFGALLANAVSNLYTAVQAGTYNFAIGTAFTVGTVDYRLNGGGWLTLIAAGLTTGSIVGVVATDTIEVRHTSTDVGAETELSMTAPGGGQNGYGVFYT